MHVLECAQTCFGVGRKKLLLPWDGGCWMGTEDWGDKETLLLYFLLVDLVLCLFLLFYIRHLGRGHSGRT